jgi:5-methyltetrahydrofolate--homocysteine methyltransferase
MSILEDIASAVEEGDLDRVKSLTEKALSQNVSAEEILNKGLVSGMNIIGEKFKNMEVFIPEVLVSARAMNGGMEILKPQLIKAKVKFKGKVVIGTVKGDLHDIGKNIVAMMLKGGGFEVADLGADVSKERFLDALKKENADILGLSALLTTTMTYMKEIIDELGREDLRPKVKVMVGGAPLTESYARSIGADGYAPDAALAVDLANNLLKKE